MTHYSLIKKTTLITLYMLKLTCPKWQGVFLIPIQIWFFLLEFLIWKTKKSSSDWIFSCNKNNVNYVEIKYLTHVIYLNGN
jgi:uncharacterized Tic20 family protein